jgi:hypothetical protein
MAPLLRDLAQAYAAIKALDLRLAPVLGEARHDMVMHQRPGAAGASKEVFAGKLGPHHTFRYGRGRRSGSATSRASLHSGFESFDGRFSTRYEKL